MSEFSGTLKQVDVAAMSEQAQAVFTYFFPRFETLNQMPLGVPSRPGQQPTFLITHELTMHYIGSRQRRFAGDHTLPRSRYWAVASQIDPELSGSSLAFSSENNQIVRDIRLRRTLLPGRPATA